jgi:aspartyl-tRNA(Asn)/glutamyl-tRNA(Gln) amidotransferase subunit A
MTAREMSALIAKKELTSREAAEAIISRIQSVEGRVNAYLTQTTDRALEQADAVDKRIANGEPIGPLAGIPIAVKDNMCTRGIRTTCASRILPNFIPPYNATVVNQIENAGAVCVGKTNLDEFAMGSSTENSGYGASHNPWNLDCVPGGSSGGSAAAVAAGEAIVALGSDTGGSIRQPASFCGLVGLKPTYGRVSRYGLVAYASSLDQIGPLTHTVDDAALMMNVISGHDPLDSTSLDVFVPDYTSACRMDVKGLRIGIPQEFYGAGVDSQISALVHKAIDKLCEMGATAEECSLPSIDYCLAAYYIIAPAEASSNLARFDGVKYGHRTKELAGHIGLMEKTRDEGFGAEVKQRIMIGTYALSAGYYDAYYKRAQQVRTLIRRDFENAFAKYDVLITPTAPTVAFRIGEKADDPLAMKLADICTLPVNMAGIPGISIPCGFQDGLPVGLQILGKAFAEETLLRTAYTYEQAAAWSTARPTL